MRITLVAIKAIMMAIVFAGAAGYGAFLYSPHDGFLYSHPESNPLPLFQPFVAATFGLLYFASFGIGFLVIVCTAAVSYANCKPTARVLSPFGIFLLATIAVGVGVGVINSFVIGHVPVMQM